MSAAQPPAPTGEGRPAWLVPALAAAAGLVAALVVLLLVRGRDGAPAPAATSPATTQAAQAKATTQDGLAELSATLKHPVYWAGPRPGDTLELTRTPDGSVYVRYLDPGVALGDRRPSFVTVGTYPQAGAYKAVTQAARRSGAQVLELPKDGRAVASRSRPKSWYLAYPDRGQLVEVYSPRPGDAEALVRRGRVVPVKG